MHFPHLGEFGPRDGLVPRRKSSDGSHQVGQEGVTAIAVTGDGKVEFIAFPGRTLAHVRSSLGYPAYYPVPPIEVRRPLRAVLMDLDGTSVRSEAFWVWIIQMTIASLLDNPRFELEEADLPFVSGHSVSEHLQYGIDKYCPDRLLEEARDLYFQHTGREMQAIVDGHGHRTAFQPAPGLKDLLLALKGRGIKVALVTSGLYEKAYPVILSAFEALGLGPPEQFYDVIITAGFPLGRGAAGTLGELTPKPHPWLYAEAFRVGLGLPVQERATALGIEDSSAGICSLRLAGIAPIGLAGGNIVEGGVQALCHRFCQDLPQVGAFILDS